MKRQSEEKFVVLKGVDLSTPFVHNARPTSATDGVAFQNASGGLRVVDLDEVKELARSSASRLLTFYNA